MPSSDILILSLTACHLAATNIQKEPTKYWYVIKGSKEYVMEKDTEEQSLISSDL